MPPHTLPPVVACGAYERDNLGDLLFLVVTDHFARDVVDVEYTAPIAVDMTDMLGRRIGATGRALTERAAAGVWTVGGEVGATQREYVYRTAVEADEWERFSLGTTAEQNAVMDEAMHARLESPYVPRPSAFPRNRDARLVLNSVGVSGIGGLTPWRAAVATGSLREASYVSVRDPKSSALLDRLGIVHRLAPDLVHTIADVLPIDAARGRTVLVQLSEDHIRSEGVDVWADALLACEGLSDRPVRFFVAGSAPAHDSIPLYREVIARLSSARPQWDVALSEARSIDDRVREIATAGLWVGSSLHGRIIACAYGTKRLSIAKPKVDVYARTWDSAFPFGIGPSTLSAAVTAALAVEADAAHAADLAAQARSSVRAALAVLTGGEQTPAPDALSVRVAEATQLQTAAMRLERERGEAVRHGEERAAEALRLAADREDQRRARRSVEAELRGLRARVDEIEGSASWRIASRLTAAGRALRLPRLRKLWRREHGDTEER